MASLMEIARKNMNKFSSVSQEIATTYFGIESLHKIQLDAMEAFISGKHVMVNAPTGFGKSLIFQMMPYVVDSLTNSLLGNSVIIVVSPLISLMMDQVNSLKAKGVCTCYLSEDISIDDIVTESGEVVPSVLYCSPEGSLNSTLWRKLLLDPSFKSVCIGVTVDEAHCISSWGFPSQQSKLPFRIWYSKLDELYALLNTFQIIFLSATLSKSMKSQILTLFSIDSDPSTLHSIHVNPLKKSHQFFKFYVDKESLLSVFEPLIFQIKSNSAPRTLILCQTRKQTAFLYQRFACELDSHLYKNRDGNTKERKVEMFHGGTPDQVKSHIVDDMSKSDGVVTVLICTNAFGMGVNCKDVTQVIHFGPSKTIENYIQECGRAGRNGSVSKCILYYNGVLSANISNEMRNYCFSNSVCLRKCLDGLFGQDTNYEFAGCACCGFCLNICDCEGPHDDLNDLIFDKKEKENTKIYRTNIPESVKNSIRLSLKKISKDSKFSTCPKLLPTQFFQFGEHQIEQVIHKLEVISNLEELKRYVEVWQIDHAKKILIILSQHLSGITISDKDLENEEEEMKELIEEWHDVVGSDEEDSFSEYSFCLDGTLLNSTLLNSTFLDSSI